MINVTSIGTSVIGENYFVMCTVDVDDSLLNIVVITTVVKIGKGVVNSSESSEKNGISLSYIPLMTSHSGQYQCVVNIRQINISYQVNYFKAFTINTTSKLYYLILIINYILIISFLSPSSQYSYHT